MKTIYADNSILLKDKSFTFLSADVVAGAVNVGLMSTLGFQSLTTSSGQILFLGELGQEKSEIIRTSNVRSSTGTNISGTGATLIAGLRFDHPQDTKVYIIDWDRFEVQTAATVGGAKSTITTYPLALQPNVMESQYKDTSVTSGFFFVRFNETINNSSSDWSDAIPYAGYADNTVFAIKQRALDSVNEVVDQKLITQDFLNRALWEARREYHNQPGKRPFRRKFNAAIGSTSTGMYRINLPDDLENPATAENVYGVRIGSERNMQYYDKKDWDWDFIKKPHATLVTAYTVGDQDLYCSSVRDFEDSGVVSIAQTNVAYSARGVSGGTLRISTQGSYDSAVGTDVWQNASYGLPDRFTVWAEVGGSSYIYFNRPLDTAYVNQNVFLDYYRTIVDFDSEADELDEPQFDMYVPYLAWKIKQRKASGNVGLDDPHYTEWLMKKNNSLAAETLSTELHMRPSIGHLTNNFHDQTA